MATGTVVFQSATLASPPANLAVMADAVNDSDHGVGTAQYIKIMDGATAGTAKASVTTANGLAVDVTRVQGTVQGLGTVQPLAGSVHVANTLPGTINTKEMRPSVQSLGTRIAGTVGNLILLQANPSRLGATFFLESGSALYLKLGSLAGTFDYTLQIGTNGYYEVPFGYTGTISGIWAFANGTVQITELS